MWPKQYRDYPVDTLLIKERVETGHGIIGCEMHELNGWGNSLHIPRGKSKKGLVRVLLDSIGKYFHGRKKDSSL